MQKISLVGLPGSGKSRLLAELKDLTEYEFSEVGLGSWEGSFPLLVLDSRSKLDEDLLEKLLAGSQGVIFNFWQDVDLEMQSWWLKSLRSRSVSQETPTHRAFPYITKGFNTITERDVIKLLASTIPAQEQDWQEFEFYEFDMPKVVLEHLVFVLESAKAQLGMDIWRATAVVQTKEYANLVAVEVTPNRIDTFAAETQEVQSLKILGHNLEEDSLIELLNASIAQGESFVAPNK